MTKQCQLPSSLSIVHQCLDSLHDCSLPEDQIPLMTQLYMDHGKERQGGKRRDSLRDRIVRSWIVTFSFYVPA